MILPDTDDVLASIIDTFDRYIAPKVVDDYAASLCLTVSQLLRSLRARIEHEAAALYEDNAELRMLLVLLAGDVPGDVRTGVEDALAASNTDEYPSVHLLQDHALRLREALVACIDSLPDREHPARHAIRLYLRNQLQRQQPWLVDAFDGPRR
jgi:hypothetical protein